jgi:hypothetical protein
LVGLGQRIVGEEYEGGTRSRYFDLTHVIDLVTGNCLYVECVNKSDVIGPQKVWEIISLGKLLDVVHTCPTHVKLYV